MRPQEGTVVGKVRGRAPGTPNSKRVVYSDKIADAICEGIASGETLTAVCGSPSMPSPPTVRHWVINDLNGFAARYNRAREVQADMFADQIVTLADEATGDANAIQKVRLQIEARKWLAGVLMPRKYGQRVSAELTGANGGPIKTEHQFPKPRKGEKTSRLARRALMSEIGPPPPEDPAVPWPVAPIVSDTSGAACRRGLARVGTSGKIVAHQRGHYSASTVAT